MSLEKQLVALHKAIHDEKRLGDKRTEQLYDLITSGGGPVSGVIPIGAIIPYFGGYFANGSNGGFTMVMAAANTIAAVNTLLNPDGFYVCNGAVLNLAASPIFNGAGRYLANISDDRFLMGDTLAGGIGGSNTMAHTHPSAYSIGNESAHTHAKGTIAAANESTHTHAKGTIATSSESAHYHAKGTLVNAAEAAHTHTKGSFAVGAHQHVSPIGNWNNRISMTAAFGSAVESQAISWTGRDAYETKSTTFYKSKSATPGFSGTSSGGSSHTHSITGNTAAGSAHAHSVTGSTAAGSAHTHTLSGSTAAGSAHSHSISGNSGAASNSENRPKYLSCFYIMRVV